MIIIAPSNVVNLPSAARTKNITMDARSIIPSLLNSLFVINNAPPRIPAIPNINVIWLRHEPIAFPTTIPDVSNPANLWNPPAILTAISGKEVPIDTIVNPMNNSEILKNLAKFCDPLTTSSAPNHNPPSPNNNTINYHDSSILFLSFK